MNAAIFALAASGVWLAGDEIGPVRQAHCRANGRTRGLIGRTRGLIGIVLLGASVSLSEMVTATPRPALGLTELIAINPSWRHYCLAAVLPRITS
jgi:hypothetical protein